MEEVQYSFHYKKQHHILEQKFLQQSMFRNNTWEETTVWKL